MFYINYIFEILALLTGLIFFSYIKPVIYRWILVVLLAAIISEGMVYFGFLKPEEKFVCFAIFFLGQLIIYYLIFRCSFVSTRIRMAADAVFLLGFVLSVLFLWYRGLGFNPFFLDAVIISLIIFGSLYLFDIYIRPSVLLLKYDSLFWFSLGLILGNFFLLLFVNATFIPSFVQDANSRVIFAVINTVGNLIYYTCIIISFVCVYLFRRQAGI